MLHASLFPEQAEAWLRDAFDQRTVNPMLHYQSYKQASQWLRLHESHSPARIDPDCAALYDNAFLDLAMRCTADPCHVIGLGAGGGQKEARLIETLVKSGHPSWFTPVDASLPLVASARHTVDSVILSESNRENSPASAPCIGPDGIVCDLAKANDLGEVLDRSFPGKQTRVFTCFGVLPNVEPEVFLPVLAGAMHPGDWLLISANRVPGSGGRSAMETILPQYQNPLTEEWLMMFLFDAGVNREDGVLQWRIESVPGMESLMRFSAVFEFSRSWTVRVQNETYSFQPGDEIRLFNSHRYTVDLLRRVLLQHGLDSLAHWVTRSGEESVFLCRA